MRHIFLWLTGIVVVVCIIGSVAVIGGAPARPAKVSDKIAAADTAFGFDLFQRLVKQEKDRNVFISPTSIALALEMTYNGTAADVKRSMAKVLHLGAMDLAQVNQGNAALMSSLRKPGPGVELQVANSLWARKGIRFKRDFVQRNRQFYDARLTTLDFASPRAKDTINGWVKDNTKGRIPSIIDSISRFDIMFLVNAVYFKGQWTDKFDAAKTKDHPFTLPGGKTKTVKMMSRHGRYDYLETPEFQAIRLPYGKGRLSMYVFLPKLQPGVAGALPKSDPGLGAFCAGLNADKWQQWMSQLKSREGTISLPRFKLEYKAELKDPLVMLGMKPAFNPTDTGFAPLTPARGVYISKVTHKTFVEVNEKGTEAAAATSVGIAVTSMPSGPPPFTMVVDHPFFCAIRDKETGAVVFMGAVTRP